MPHAYPQQQAASSDDDEACVPPPLLPAPEARRQALVPARSSAAATAARRADSSAGSDSDEPPRAWPASSGDDSDEPPHARVARHRTLLLNLALAADAAAAAAAAGDTHAAGTARTDHGGGSSGTPLPRVWPPMGPSGSPATDAIRRAWHIIHRESAAPAALAAATRQQQRPRPRHQQRQQQHHDDDHDQQQHTSDQHDALHEQQAQRQEHAKQQPAGGSPAGLYQQLPAESCLPPAPCSFLRPGMVFRGSQRLMPLGPRRREEQWEVCVTLQEVDLSCGHVAGSMTADVAGGRVETFWEGQVIDDARHTFYTRDWGACLSSDMRHWSKFEAFAAIQPLVERHGGRCGQLARHPLVYMRWKEAFFVGGSGPAGSGLTIQGFYYVALDRSSGDLRGFYYDQSSSPFQELNLAVQHQPNVQRERQQERRDCQERERRPGAGSGRLPEQAPASGAGDTAPAVAAAGLGGGMSFASFSFA